MKNKYILIILTLLLMLTFYLWGGKNASIDPDKDAKHNAAHDAFIKNQLKPSPAYNVLDYTKPAPKQQ